ncbi:MAG: hypothetical protein ACYDER_08375 [Ktedonobacteraceae bacterium]
MTAAYVIIALIAAIPAALAFVLYIFVWAWLLFRPQVGARSSIELPEPGRTEARADERAARNHRLENVLPPPVRSQSSFVLEDAFLPIAGKVRPRDQRAAQSAAEKLTQGKPDETILFAAQSLKGGNTRWNALLREVATLPVKPHHQTWIEQQIPKTMNDLERDDKQDVWLNASQIIVLGIWYFNALKEKEPDRAHACAKNWHDMGKAYSCVAALSRKEDTIYHQAALKCYQHATTLSHL